MANTNVIENIMFKKIFIFNNFKLIKVKIKKQSFVRFLYL